MAERRAALGVRPVRAGTTTTRDNCHDHTLRCACKNACPCERLGLRRAHDLLLFDVVANFAPRDWAHVSCEHDASARLHTRVLAIVD
jgi:hypothetical protein